MCFVRIAPHAHTTHHVCRVADTLCHLLPYTPYLVCNCVLGDVSKCECTDDVAVALSGEEELLRWTEEEVHNTDLKHLETVVEHQVYNIDQPSYAHLCML